MWRRFITDALPALKTGSTDGDATVSRHGLALQGTPSLLPDTSGHVANTAPQSMPVGGKSMDLTARAYRLANKNKDQAQRYLDLHLVLSKGVYSNADHNPSMAPQAIQP
jgi:hypothetical protein